ncbi:MAG: histidine triad nucleotide-binding protein [Oscillospiraceae bacterium]|nr:histidine triad nucleotide-binding protein [Oscillospiraceae bacterium]
MDCIFCKIIAGEIPSKKVYEDDRMLAFWDIVPKAPVHLLLIPKRHIAGAAALDEAAAGDVGYIFSRIPEIASSLGLLDYRIVTNNGLSAGQTVFHLHFHLLGGRPLAEMG